MKWTSALARAPLPMLALAASYGVFEFQRLFVPVWVAFISAAAFEVTYVALAFVGTSSRRRATAVSVAAVVVSVAYNTLAALFARRPALLVDTPLWGDVALASLHGLPLAVVAYNVAALLLHDAAPTLTTPPAALQVTQAVQVNVSAPESATVTVERPALADESAPLSKTAKVARLASARGVSTSTAWRKVKDGEWSV